jgi:transposase-like protein|tara:strand:- start:2549 stop:2851 length:303 start_codon:yes stop_codon:yes gene_type:complete
MYDENFRNQAVKECVNGQSLRGTARKYGISDSALRSWVNEYRERMAEIGVDNNEGALQLGVTTKEPIVHLNSVNINIDGYDITISKEDIMRLMEIFRQFE